MKCPYCGEDDTRVIDSRPADDNASIRRRRQCDKCGKRFTTYEKVEAIPLVVIKKDQSRESYDRTKIESGVFRSCHKRAVSIDQMNALVDQVEAEIFNQEKREIPSSYIGELVMNHLEKLDPVAYVRFASVYREFKDVSIFIWMRSRRSWTNNESRNNPDYITGIVFCCCGCYNTKIYIEGKLLLRRVKGVSMYSKTFCVAVQGIEGHMVQIEADISDGLPVFSLVGDLSSETKEAKERVRVALQNTGFRFPPRRVTVNLSPADIRKDGTGYDLAIAVAVLSAYGYISKSDFSNILLIGELSLEGEVRPVSGVLPMVYGALSQGISYCILSSENQEEASVVSEMNVIGVKKLREVIDLLEDCLLYTSDAADIA